MLGAVALFACVFISSAVVTLAATGTSLVAVPVLFFLALAAGERWFAPRSDRVLLSRSAPAGLPPGSCLLTGSEC